MLQLLWEGGTLFRTNPLHLTLQHLSRRNSRLARYICSRKKFSNVETAWKTVEVPVRAKSNNGYTAVEIYMNQIKHALYDKPLSREKAILSLHFLEESIENAILS